ncbi:hypothetical protein IG557_06725 [Vibrio cholerae]|nr:hypothetical protein [Vibrio cholerae]EJL6706112.1 hypothetical protein [Vibrio cholerae]MCX9558580.1 hypothetical protein [Vibrio cholerae]MCX9561407.1 hypothetical protein [Vibrio cholerae]HDI3278160.1 hypothetical protein [Vibrio cholerae]
MIQRTLNIMLPKVHLNVVALFAVFALVGCASNESITLVSEYADQTTKVQETLMDVYKSADEARVNAELVKATRDGVTVNGLDIVTIDSSGQERLLHNLKTFSQSIYVLATDDRTEELDNYSKKLNASIESLSELPQVGSTDANDIKLLSVSINAIARTYTEKKRYDLLKTILIDSETIIQRSFDSLKSELDSWKHVTKISLEKELQIRLYLLNNPNRCEVIEDKRCVTFNHSLEERVDAYKKTYEIKIRLNNLDSQYAKLERALSSIQDLNQSIVMSLKSDDDLTKNAAKKALQSTKVQIDAIKDFRDTLGE